MIHDRLKVTFAHCHRSQTPATDLCELQLPLSDAVLSGNESVIVYALFKIVFILNFQSIFMR